MKKFLPYILIVFTLVNFLAPVGIGLSRENRVAMDKKVANAEDDCKIVSANWLAQTTKTDPHPSDIGLVITTTNGCIDGSLSVDINETSGMITNDDQAVVRGIMLTKDTTFINFKPGETQCDSSFCEIGYSIFAYKKGATSPTDILNEEDTLAYGCINNVCDKNIKWDFELEEGASVEGKYNFNITPTIKASNTAASVDILVNEISNTSTGSTGVTWSSSNLYTRITIKDENGKEMEDKKQEQRLLSSNQALNFLFNDLESNKKYTIKISIIEKTSSTTPGGFTSTHEDVIGTPITKDIKTNEATNQIFTDQGAVKSLDMQKKQASSDPMPECNLFKGKIMGCIAQILYYVLFVPTSYIFALAGNFFDYTFAYSVDDNSYRSPFVMNGWALIRDFCNMFFIFILLYIAFTTILGTAGSKTKEMIINVVIIGLLINFSLFTTQVIIDASNILARVFYNSDSIKITEKGANATVANTSGLSSTPSDPNKSGVIPLSAALVNKVNPQNIIINSAEVSNTSKSNTNVVEDGESLSVGRFIIVVLLATAINCVGFMVFLTVGLIFISRVIGLWMAMILSPLAFFSYMVPKLKGMKTVGWDNWLSDLVSMSFLAPVFIFFLYIILKFLETNMLPELSGTGIQMVVATIVPFAFIMILMLRAKDIAKNMSGEMGQAITGAISKVGGLALGAATGGAALAARGTIGRAGSAIANSERVKKWESQGKFGAATLRNIGSAAGKGSFDARNTKAGAMFEKESGIGMGKGGGAGGFVKVRADKTAARIKRSKDLEVGPDDNLTAKLRAAESSKKQLSDSNSSQIKQVDKDITNRRQDVADANARLASVNPNDVKAKAEAQSAAQKANDDLREAQNRKKDIISGGVKMKTEKDDQGNEHSVKAKNDDGTYQYNTTNGNISSTELKNVLQQLVTSTQNLNDSERKLAEATKKVQNSPTQQNIDALNAARTNRDNNLEENKKAKREATVAQASADRNGGVGKSLSELQNKDIPDAENAIEEENNRRKTDYSKEISSKKNKVMNFISSGGTHSSNGADEASHRILMDAK